MVKNSMRSLQATLKARSLEEMTASAKEEWVRLLGTIANRQLDLKQYKDAKASYQQVLQMVGAADLEKRKQYDLEARIYHQLGRVASEQRQWEQAEKYYQQALQIKIEFNARYEQASTYHNLGRVASEQRQWEQAEKYYQQALQISIEFNARYEQASTYHQLGMVAQQFRQWEQAQEHFLEALRLFTEYKDTENSAIVLRSLARLWRDRKETDLVKQVASILGSTPEAIEAIFQKATEPASTQSEEADTE